LPSILSINLTLREDDLHRLRELFITENTVCELPHL